MKKQTIIVLFVLIGFFVLNCTAQETEAKIDPAEQQEVVKSIGDILEKNYVFPEVAKKMAAHIQQKLKKGKYNGITFAEDFADRLVVDLREISKDKHIRVSFAPEVVNRMRKAEEKKDDSEILKEQIKQGRKANFGFKEVKILPGNIGYLNFNRFAPAWYAGDTAVAAMNFLANCDALIIDMRQNGGGDPGMIQLVTSYLYKGDDEVHLNSFYWRPGDKNTQTWTLPHVPGPRMPKIDVYVLTSQRTFSAAEEFSYNLKNLKRATLIGETTGGGAHPGGPKVVNDHFIINVPSGRAINPITNTNWEGTGVKPDVEVPQEKALLTGHKMALKKLVDKTEDKRETFIYEWYIKDIEAQLQPVTVDPEVLKTYVGKYGPRNILFENGELYYQREGRPKFKMIPLSENLFKFNELDYFRLAVIKENGTITKLLGLYDNGETDENPKDK
jgi:C-terminal processing protease CtpA/Prc